VGWRDRGWFLNRLVLSAPTFSTPSSDPRPDPDFGAIGGPPEAAARPWVGSHEWSSTAGAAGTVA
jgi:hypothetical protein